jgi:hypothetical protein
MPQPLSDIQPLHFQNAKTRWSVFSGLYTAHTSQSPQPGAAVGSRAGSPLLEFG